MTETSSSPNPSDLEDSLFASIALSPIATIITDMRQPDYPVVATNAAFCELTGYSEDEIIGRNCRFLSGPKTDPRAQRTLGDAIREARPAITEVLNYKKDGSTFRNAVMIAPIMGPDGEVAYYLGSQMDVSEGKNLPGPIRQQRAKEQVSMLTPRQRQVLEQMIQGLRNKQIAARLGIDEKTVKMHRAGLLVKLGASTSADAIRLGVEAGIA